MIINRHNYEEFFLLYVDNELSLTDRKAVEKFVQDNPDLAEEMEMLKQSTLPQEEITFEQKDILYNQADGISLNNYEEYFLLSIDNELTQQENEEVEKFVLKHPELQNEYMLLEQARLEPEAIVFAEKGKLYRKEGKERRVVFVSWMRISAAAAFIGLVVTAWLITQNKAYPPGNGSITASQKIAKPSPEKTEQSEKPAVAGEAVAKQPEKTLVKAETTLKVTAVKVEKPKKRSEVLAVNALKNKPVQTVVPTEKIAVEAEPLQKKKSFEEAIASAKLPEKSKSRAEYNEPEPLNATLAGKPAFAREAPTAKHAVYREIDNQEDEENSFYIGSAEINKNKLKGLFKKAASLFDKKSNNNDEERSLRIAGFEIKSK